MSAERAKEVTNYSLKVFDFLFLTSRSILENQKSCNTSHDTKKAVTALKDIRYAGVLKLEFLAAKAQLNPCTCPVSVCLSVRFKTEFLPVLCPFMPLYVPLCPFMPLLCPFYAPFMPLIPLYAPVCPYVPLYAPLYLFTSFYMLLHAL